MPPTATRERVDEVGAVHLGERGPNLRPLGPAPDEAESLEPAQAGEADVLADRAAEDEPVVLARLGDHGDARLDRRRRLAADGGAADEHLPGAQGAGPVDRPGELGPSAPTNQRGRRSPRPQGEGRRCPAPQALDGDGDRSFGGGLLGRIGAADRPPEHPGNERRPVSAAPVGPRARRADGDDIRRARDLAEEVRTRSRMTPRAAARLVERSTSFADRLADGSSRTMRSASRASARGSPPAAAGRVAADRRSSPPGCRSRRPRPAGRTGRATPVAR